MSPTLPPLIALEEHWLSPAYVATDCFKERYGQNLKNTPGLEEKLRDVSQIRMQQMQQGNVSLQIVSHGPGLIAAQECQQANDELYEAVKQNPTRFGGFAVLPVAEPEACATELKRCVLKLGFKGALIDNHTRDGNFYHGPAYDTMWETFEKLNVPCYLHPTWATAATTSNLYSDEHLSEAAAWSVATSGWGWHSEVGIHILKLFASSVFDRYPRLKIIIGHFGEMLPFMLDRVSLMSRRWKHTGKNIRQVWDENIWITTSGVWSLDPMATILRNTKIDRILFSVDYPLADIRDGKRWMEELCNSGMLDQDGIERIAFRNAETLLQVKINADIL